MTNQAMTRQAEATSLWNSGLWTLGREAASRLLKLYVAYLTWRQIRCDERYLLGQSDQILADIGLARADIPGALRREVRD